MSDVRVQLERSRPTCPFCRAAVEGGEVWLCPACYAPHHAACQLEHPGCAACAHTRTTMKTDGEPLTGPPVPSTALTFADLGLRELLVLTGLGTAVAFVIAAAAYALHALVTGA